MKRTKKFLAVFLFAFFGISLVGCGFNGAETVGASPQETIQEETGGEAADDFSSTGYVLARDMSLRPIEDGRETGSLELQAGQEIALIERKSDSILGDLVRIGIDAADESGQPTDVWVREADLIPADLIPYAPDENIEESDSGQGEEVDLFRRKMTYCYRYVKLYLLKIGKVKSYLPGGSAYMAAKTLPKHGFRRSGHTPATARNGEVCVYAGGPQGHGHIEVKRNGKWWYGYGFKARPIANRRFIACFVK